MSKSFIVIIRRAWCNEGGHGIEYSSDLIHYETRHGAISHGFRTVDSDDFNIGVIQASVSQDVIDAEGAEDFASSARYYQCWYKVSPIGGQEGYSGWHHPRDTPCRGAYFASVLQWD